MTKAAQQGLPTTMDAGTAIKHTTDQSAHDARMRETDEADAAKRKAWADAEVASWPAPRSYAPRPASAENNQQRVPVSFEPANADEMWRYAQMLARSKLLPKAFYDKDDKEKAHANVADVHFVLMRGHALGLHPQVSIASLNIIDGKTELAAQLIVALIMRSGLCKEWRLVKSDERSAIYVTHRLGSSAPIEFEYTIEEAEQMGLLDKGRTDWEKANNNWRKQPRTMLRRRAQSNLGREAYPDICLGLYDTGELDDLRSREMAIGVNPDRVIAVDAMSGSNVLELEQAAGPGAIARMSYANADRARVVDPIKERIHQLRKTETAEPVHIGVRKCSLCQAPLDPRDDDPCIACR